MSVKGVTVLDEDERAVVDDVSFDVHKGEILGIAGVEGNGQSELIDALVGTRAVDAGSIEIKGLDVADRTVRERREAGVSYVPEDRHRMGLIDGFAAWETAILGYHRDATYNGPLLLKDDTIVPLVAGLRTDGLPSPDVRELQVLLE